MLIEQCSIEAAVRFSSNRSAHSTPSTSQPPELFGDASPLVTIVTRDDRVRKHVEALGYAVE